MSNYHIILNSFGLQHIKPMFYGKGTPLQIGDSGPFNHPPSVLEYFPRFDTGTKNEQRMSLLGTPIFSDMILQYKDLKLTFDIVLCTVTQKKNIVSTSIVGRNGTIKEYINEDDYDINLKGSFSSGFPNVPPKDDLIMLRKLVAVNDSIEVISPFLDLFDVHNIVVKSSKIEQPEGKLNVVTFDISCLSDLELSIIVNEE